ncbi:fimbrial protein [Buttiauxella sp. B2]|uniref:fimbrial protein n=1 Tax=Buttiauxella sp. B2 TaxID=2587812 RepID=UPI00111CC71D|nr:fimbrial protein [Buttiauxella sp. B2]TNV17207.1 fimbrial protein [Buttiauxella sp. B2]
MTHSLLSRFAALFLFALFALWATSSSAHDGSVNITGSIVDKTCAVSADSKSLLVTFGDVSRKTFARAGDASRYEPFAINLEKCGAGASNVTVTFTGNADSRDPALLALTVVAGGATGVAIAIYDSEKEQIPLGQPGGGSDLAPNQASVTLNFYARYLANGGTVASGPANSSATFMLNYA